MPSDLDKELIDVATSLEYAAKCFKRGDFQEAEPIYRHALEVLERVYGAGDPDTLSALQSLGDLYFTMERYKEAVPIYRRLVIIGEKVFGKTHPNVVEMVHRLALTYEKLGMTTDAESMYRRANQISETAMPALDPASIDVSTQTNKSFKRGRNTNTRLKALDPNDYIEEDTPSFRRSRKRIRASEKKMNPILDFLITLRGYTSMIFAVIVMIALMCCAYLMYSKLGTPVVKVAKTELRHLNGFEYASGDGQIQLSLKKGAPDYRISGVPVESAIGFYGPDLWDFKDTIANSLLNKEIWYEQVSVGLRSEDGSILYSKDSPEFRVIGILSTLQTQMMNNFRANAKYPTTKEEMAIAAYNNPVTGARENPTMTYMPNTSKEAPTGVNDIMPGPNQTLYQVLAQIDSARWGLEPIAARGAIHCLSIYHAVSSGDLREFYAHGFDHNGYLIQAGKPNSVYLIGMHNNDLYQPDKVEYRKGGRPVKVCIIKPPKGAPLWLLHYFVPVFSGTMVVFLFALDKFGRPAGERWTAEKMSAMMRLCWVFAIIALAYLVSYLCP